MNAGFVKCKEEPENVVNVHLSSATLHMACLLQHPVDALSNGNVVFRHLRIRHSLVTVIPRKLRTFSCAANHVLRFCSSIFITPLA